MLMKPGHDWFFPYYREKAIAYALGMSPKDIFLHMLSREGDPSSNGRNMPEHFSSRELNLVSGTACTGTQYLPAVGAAKALKKDGSDAIVYVSSGEGATSEGEFFEALNWATREELARPVCHSEQRIRHQRPAELPDGLDSDENGRRIRSSSAPCRRHLV